VRSEFNGVVYIVFCWYRIKRYHKIRLYPYLLSLLKLNFFFFTHTFIILTYQQKSLAKKKIITATSTLGYGTHNPYGLNLFKNLRNHTIPIRYIIPQYTISPTSYIESFNSFYNLR